MVLITRKEEGNELLVLSEIEFQMSLSDGAPIILCLRGNTGTRALYHHIEVYK